MKMDDFVKQDLEAVLRYMIDTEFDDFCECISGTPEKFPGLDPQECDQMWGGSSVERYHELAAKAARNPANMHVYACAFRAFEHFFNPAKECKRCGSPLIKERCKDLTCPYSDYPQTQNLEILEEPI